MWLRVRGAFATRLGHSLGSSFLVGRAAPGRGPIFGRIGLAGRPVASAVAVASEGASREGSASSSSEGSTVALAVGRAAAGADAFGASFERLPFFFGADDALASGCDSSAPWRLR